MLTPEIKFHKDEEINEPKLKLTKDLNEPNPKMMIIEPSLGFVIKTKLAVAKDFSNTPNAFLGILFEQRLSDTTSSAILPSSSSKQTYYDPIPFQFGLEQGNRNNSFSVSVNGADSVANAADRSDSDMLVDTNSKIFINICHSNSIPNNYQDLKDDEILQSIRNYENSNFKVSLSLSQLLVFSSFQPSNDSFLNKSKPQSSDQGKYLVIDACINTHLFNLSQRSYEFKLFLADLASQWIQQKFSISMEPLVKFPKLSVKGKLSRHYIKSRPNITVIMSTPKEKEKKKKQEIITLKTPRYTVFYEPQEKPLFVVCQMHMPELEDCKETDLEVEEKRLLLKNKWYTLDIGLDVNVDLEKVGATFNCSTKYLHITMHVL